MKTLKTKSAGIHSYMLWFFASVTFLILLNIISAFIPRDQLVKRTKQAFAKSHLLKSDVGGNIYGLDAWRGNHQYQDCLVLMQALHLSDDWKENAFLGPKSGEAKCQWLYDYVFEQQDQEELMSTVHMYWQYNHGTVAVTSIFCSVIPLELYRALLKFITILLTALSGIALILVSDKKFKGSGLAIAGMGAVIMLLTLHGFDFFGQNLSHGLGDWISIGFFAILMWSIHWGLSYKKNVILCIIFGSLSAYIEYLIGILPFCIISILIFGAIKNRIDSTYNFSKVFRLLFTYGISFAGTFVVFLLVKYFLVNDSIFKVFYETFTYRINGETYSIGDVYTGLIDYLYFLGSGNKKFVYLSLIFIGLSLVSTIIIRFKQILLYKTSNYLFLAAAIFPFFWYTTFINHTAGHPWFMLRFSTLSLISIFIFTCLLLFEPKKILKN
ncbi:MULTISPECIES: hypothetical protein [Aquimarina]|uniref:hypothetical protein n=2 Tax=Flavobacteriaceae TaxID=49546 RepID=UPI0009450421|nr:MULTISPECIES: hypothetical protein [Aquimarina]